jgi:mono/diheme cytochrome c family protein
MSWRSIFADLRSPIYRGVVICVCVLASGPGSAQDGGSSGAQPTSPPALPSGKIEPPDWLTDEARIERGKNRFNALCAAYCHGFEGSGGKTPAFRGRTDLDAVSAFKTITVGRVGSDVMPAWGNGFSEEKRWELVAYIMYLTRQPPK